MTVLVSPEEVDALQLPHAIYLRGARESDPERLAAAEAKRARKNARRVREISKLASCCSRNATYSVGERFSKPGNIQFSLEEIPSHRDSE
jgi:hypothetical protein